MAPLAYFGASKLEHNLAHPDRCKMAESLRKEELSNQRLKDFFLKSLLDWSRLHLGI